MVQGSTVIPVKHGADVNERRVTQFIDEKFLSIYLSMALQSLWTSVAFSVS
jgi:hypothetical protein